MRKYILYVLLLCILLSFATGCNAQDPVPTTTTDVSLVSSQSQQVVSLEQSKPESSKAAESTPSQTEKQSTSNPTSVTNKEQNVTFFLNEKVDYPYNYKGTHPNPPEVVVCRSLEEWNTYQSTYQRYDQWEKTYTQEYFESKSLLLFLAHDFILSAEKVAISNNTLLVEFTEPAMETDTEVAYYLFPLEIHHTLHTVKKGELVITGIEEVSKISFEIQ